MTVKNFSRAELEAIKFASDEGLTPTVYFGFGKLTYGDMAEELLEAKDEILRLRHLITVNSLLMDAHA